MTHFYFTFSRSLFKIFKIITNTIPLKCFMYCNAMTACNIYLISVFMKLKYMNLPEVSNYNLHVAINLHFKGDEIYQTEL